MSKLLKSCLDFIVQNMLSIIVFLCVFAAIIMFIIDNKSIKEGLETCETINDPAQSAKDCEDVYKYTTNGHPAPSGKQCTWNEGILKCEKPAQ